MGNVMVIPARRQVGNTVKQSAQKKLRVAAYCRVSTDSFKKVLITRDAPAAHYDPFGIFILPLRDFLLNPACLNG